MAIILPRAELGGDFVPLEDAVIHAMLELAETGGADEVWDLGCGDARTLAAAVRPPFAAARAVGFELQPDVAARAAAMDGVRVVVGNAADEALLAREGIARASVVLLFVTANLLSTLEPIIARLCSPDCRVVAATHAFEGGWRPVAQRVVSSDDQPAGTAPMPSGLRRTVRLWVVRDLKHTVTVERSQTESVARAAQGGSV